MEEQKINTKSLIEEMNSPFSEIENFSVESLVDEITFLLDGGDSIENVILKLSESAYQLDEISGALGELGYKPEDVTALFQNVESMVQEQQAQQQPNPQAQPMTQEQAMMINDAQGPQQPMMSFGGMFAAGTNFALAAKDFGNERKGHRGQHKDGTLGRKRHAWKVDFKDKKVNPKDYYVTDQGELKKFKNDTVFPDVTEIEKSPFDDEEIPFTPQDLSFIPQEQRDAWMNKAEMSKYIATPENPKVGQTYFEEWLDKNKPKPKMLNNQKSYFDKMGEYGPIKKPSMMANPDYKYQEGGENDECLTGNCIDPEESWANEYDKRKRTLDEKLLASRTMDDISSNSRLLNAWENLSRYYKEPYTPQNAYDDSLTLHNSNVNKGWYNRPSTFNTPEVQAAYTRLNNYNNMHPYQIYTYNENNEPSGHGFKKPTNIPSVPNYDTDLSAYLKREGKPRSYSDRKKLAVEYGIEDYKGTSKQNIELLNLIKNNETAPVENSTISKQTIIPEQVVIPETPIQTQEVIPEQTNRADQVQYKQVLTGYKQVFDPETGKYKRTPQYKDQGYRARGTNIGNNTTTQKKYGGYLPKAQEGNGEKNPISFYDYAIKEYNYFIDNPGMWNEDPDMMNPDGSFKFCLDCINKNYDNPDHLKGIIRLMQEGITKGPHNTEWANELDDFNAGLKKYNITLPTLSQKKYGGYLPKAQFGYFPNMANLTDYINSNGVSDIPTTPFSNIEEDSFMGGNMFNPNASTNNLNKSMSNPVGGSGHYYLGSTGPGSGMGGINMDDMEMQDIASMYESDMQNQNNYSGSTDYMNGEDPGAWDQDPTVKRTKRFKTGMSNAENWLKNSKLARKFGSASNLLVAGANVANEYSDMKNQQKAEERQRLSEMGDNRRIYYGDAINYAQSAQTGLYGEKTRGIFEVAKYGSEIYTDGGSTKNWFEANGMLTNNESAELDVDTNTLAALIAAGADIEIL